MILYKYLQTRVRLHTWMTLEYGQNGRQITASTEKKGTGALGTLKSMRSRRSRAYSGSQQSATFDNWLVIRLFIAFVMLWYGPAYTHYTSVILLKDVHQLTLYQRLRMDQHLPPLQEPRNCPRQHRRDRSRSLPQARHEHRNRLPIRCVAQPPRLPRLRHHQSLPAQDVADLSPKVPPPQAQRRRLPHLHLPPPHVVHRQQLLRPRLDGALLRLTKNTRHRHHPQGRLPLPQQQRGSPHPRRRRLPGRHAHDALPNHIQPETQPVRVLPQQQQQVRLEQQHQ